MCFLAGVRVTYLLASTERFALLWVAAIVISATQLLFISLLRRFGWYRASIFFPVAFMAAWVGLAGLIEWDCRRQADVPGYFESSEKGHVWRDNDGAVRTMMFAAGIVFPTVFLSLLAMIVSLATSLRHGASGLRPRNITGQRPNVNR